MSPSFQTGRQRRGRWRVAIDTTLDLTDDVALADGALHVAHGSTVLLLAHDDTRAEAPRP